MPALADHTEPREPKAPIDGVVVDGLTRGAGTWVHVANFPGAANPALTGGGTDLEFFRGGATATCGARSGHSARTRPAASASGSSGSPATARSRALEGRPRLRALPAASPSVTGLQHDTQVATTRRLTHHRHHRRHRPLPRPREAGASRSSTPPKVGARRSGVLARCTWSGSRGSPTPTPSTGGGRGSSTAAAPTSRTATGST